MSRNLEIRGSPSDDNSICTALGIKARNALLLQRRGFTAVRILNHVNNPATLAVNERLGYQPMSERIYFVGPVPER